MLIEHDKRSGDCAVRLQYAKQHEAPFFVPDNVHLLGLMNTADRSLAIVDYALRRRFRFFDLRPQFEHPQFRTFLASRGIQESIIAEIISRIPELNKKIAADSTNLGPGFEIGHSYFCPSEVGDYGEEWLRLILKTEIVPLLEEYWFDNPKRVKDAIRLIEGREE
jgi:5-methylcytosine-specific restriction protein B